MPQFRPPARPTSHSRRRTSAVLAAAAVLAGLLLASAPAAAQDEPLPSQVSVPDPTLTDSESPAPALADPASPDPAGASPMLSPQNGAAATFRFDGRGWGHGRGMGQYGALGYATVWGASAATILDWYYGGTTAASVGTARDIRVRLTAADNRWFVVASDRGDLVTNATGAQRFRTLLVIPQPDNTFALFGGSDCVGNGGWWFAGVSTPPVQFWIANSRADAYDRGQWFALCGDDGLRYYRGWAEAVTTTSGSRVVNQLPLEQYLRGVLPREVPASWGDVANGAGMQALMAQAVAARSYALAEQRASLWQTCDTAACQVYGGAALWSPSRSLLLEDHRTDAAIVATGGVVRLGADGRVARTEFSSSTGGHTAGGTFPAVPDWGDAIPANPNWMWTAQVSAAPLEAEFPALGRVTGITVLARNGLGELGGRATQVQITGTNGSTVIPGDDLRFYLGLKSDWFTVTRTS